jgi:ABC-type uncharacterized transport system permease subunit
MNGLFFGLAAIVLYLTVAVQTSEIARASASNYAHRPATAALGLLALVAHALALYPMMVTKSGINLGVFSASSLVAWLIATIAIAATMRRPVASLAVVVLPIAALAVGASLLFSHRHLVDPRSPGLALHIALSLVAYSLFAIAALEAAYLAFAAHRLKRHAPVMRFLPPLPVMEQFLFQLTGVAFILLSCGLAIGAFYIEDVRGQHLSHKIVFSVLAWLVFAVLLAGRHFRHWRGRRAAKYVIAGFVLLALAFFGSKIVLELVLHRA